MLCAKTSQNSLALCPPTLGRACAETAQSSAGEVKRVWKLSGSYSTPQPSGTVTVMLFPPVKVSAMAGKAAIKQAKARQLGARISERIRFCI